MTLSITYNNFIPGTTIFSSQTNTNNADIANWANTHEITSSGIHGVGAGQIVGTQNNNSFSGSNIFAGLTSLFATQTIQAGRYVSNGTFTLNAGILSLRTATGAAPSSSDPVYFRIPSSTLGRWNTLTFTSSTHCSISDASTVDSYFFNGAVGTPLGTVAGRAWGNATPFTIYIATDGTTPVLFLSRQSNAHVTPATALIGYKDNAPASSNEKNFFAFSATNVTVTHANVQCWPIGSFSMVKAANSDWTIQTLLGGPMHFWDYRGGQKTFPTGQNGADVGAYTQVSGGGTGPTYTDVGNYTYWINENGQVHVDVRQSNAAGGVAGAGAGDLQLALPFIGDVVTGTVGLFLVTNGATANICMGEVVAGLLKFRPMSGPTTFLTGNDQNNVSRSIRGTIIYNAFVNNP